MGDFLPFEQIALRDFNLTPALHSPAQVAEWDEFCRHSGQPLPFHLDVDTGMNRLGAREAPLLREVVAGLRFARCEGLMTHLAAPGDFSSTQTPEQLKRFQAIRASLQSAGIAPRHVHMASSAAVAYGLRQTWGTLVRPGLALYGYVSAPTGPAPECLLDVKPVLSWKARILEIKDLPAGAWIGYNGTYRTPHPTRMAIVAAGYADGFRHSFSNRSRVIAGGAWAPVIGAVSMDVCAVDITACPPLEKGSAVTLLGTEGVLTIDGRHLAATAGTVIHDILSGIGHRVRRFFHPLEA
jgi:alanine racemase